DLREPAGVERQRMAHADARESAGRPAGSGAEERGGIGDCRSEEQRERDDEPAWDPGHAALEQGPCPAETSLCAVHGRWTSDENVPPATVCGRRRWQAPCRMLCRRPMRRVPGVRALAVVVLLASVVSVAGADSD